MRANTDTYTLDKETLLSRLVGIVHLTDVYQLFGHHRNPNTRTRNGVKQHCKQLGIDLLTVIAETLTVSKTCPICGILFSYPRSTRDKVTCSSSCANRFFRSGVDNPNHRKNPAYRTLCWLSHDKKCVICAETRIVSVHHLDENHQNNAPENLIPLCPTHHQYWHSGCRYLIEEKVLAYAAEFRVAK